MPRSSRARGRCGCRTRRPALYEHPGWALPSPRSRRRAPPLRRAAGRSETARASRLPLSTVQAARLDGSAQVYGADRRERIPGRRLPGGRVEALPKLTTHLERRRDPVCRRVAGWRTGAWRRRRRRSRRRIAIQARDLRENAEGGGTRSSIRRSSSLSSGTRTKPRARRRASSILAATDGASDERRATRRTKCCSADSSTAADARSCLP